MHQSIRDGVMNAIRDGKASMRPRWQFLLFSALTILGTLIAFLAVVYAVSLVVFFLRESGAFFLPGFGGRGWFDLFRSLPIPILLLLLLFVLILELLVRRFAFVYTKPLVVSVLGILALLLLGGLALAQTPLHGELVHLARAGHLPPPIGDLYRPPFTMHSDDVYRGRIVEIRDQDILIASPWLGTTTVHLTPRTRLPAGADFEAGDTVIVIGDEMANGTIEAFGMREVAPGTDY